jgi:CHAT domain-containing protein
MARLVRMRPARLSCTALSGAVLWIVLCSGVAAAGQRPDPEHIRTLLDRGAAAAAEREATALQASLDSHDEGTALEALPALNLLVEARVANGKAAEAATREMAERAVRLTEHRHGRQAPELAVSLHNLATVLVELGDLKTALATHERALAIRERQSPHVDADLATSLEHVALIEIRLERFTLAQEKLQRAMVLRGASTDGPPPLALVHMLEVQAGLDRQVAKYKAGIARLERGVAIRARYMPDQPQTPGLLGLRGDLLYLTGDITEAKHAWTDGLALATELLDPLHPARVRLLRSLALAADALGDRVASRELLAQAVDIGLRSLAPCNTETAGLLNDSAQSKERDGDFAKAKTLYRQQLSTLEKCHANANWMATALHNSANLAFEMGDVAEAERLHQRAIRVWSAGLGRQHPYVARGLDALAEVVASRGEFARARALYQRALKIRRRDIETGRPDVAWTLTNLARTIADQGQVELALGYVQEAIATYKRAGAFDEPDHLARSLELQGLLQARRGDLADAHASLVAAIAERQRIFGAAHPLVAESRAALARVELAEGSLADALRDALDAERSGRDHLRFLVRYLPERQAMTYSAKRPRGLDLALSIADRDASAAPVLDAVIRSRGVILDELALRARAPDVQDSESAALRAAAVQARQRYANLVVRSLQEPVQSTVLAEARQQKEDAETTLAEHSAAARAELARAQVGLDEVRAALPQDAALVSFIKYDRQESSSRRVPSYGAFVQRAGADAVVFVPVGPASTVEPLVRSWRNEAAGRAMAIGVSPGAAQRTYLDVAQRLRRLVWDPLAAHLAGATRVFIVPDGLLNLLNFAALPNGDGHYLAEEPWILHYLSAERDLMTPAETTAGRGLLAVGGASFNQPSRKAPAPLKLSLVPTRGVSDCLDLRHIQFDALPGSQREVVEISRTWSAREHDAVVVLTGRAATETAVKQALAGQRVVHLATHGFFLGAPCEPVSAGTRGVGGLAPVASPRRRAPTDENPLLLAGLAFAGANRRAGDTTAGSDDGILTAEEIAGLDLQGTEWAVLSACDTGLGEITTSEGVVGLRRAFQIAGARTVIMSLWAVEDHAAAQWMRALYDGRLSKSLDTATAVHEANLALLRDRRAKAQSVHPFFWAGFVAVGDWH